MQDQGTIELAPVAAGRQIPTASLDAHGIICRPSHGGHLTPELVEVPGRPLVIGTLSKGKDHIRLPENWIREIVHVIGEGNARAVADLTVILASEILRPVNEAATEMLHHGWEINIEATAYQFDGLKWGCVGAGDQVRYLLPQLVARRCAEITIFHPALDASGLWRFKYATDELSANDPANIGENLRLEVPCPGGGTTVVKGISGRDSLGDFLNCCDVVSLHVPAESEAESKYDFRTFEIICRENIEKMRQGARIVNVSRGALVNERDAVEALSDGRIGGFAADVINLIAEQEGDPSLSPLWMESCRLDDIRSEGQIRERRLYLTPHVGGGTREALCSVAADVLPRFLASFGLATATGATE